MDPDADADADADEATERASRRLTPASAASPARASSPSSQPLFTARDPDEDDFDGPDMDELAALEAAEMEERAVPSAGAGAGALPPAEEYDPWEDLYD
jgi:hypothetical protein